MIRVPALILLASLALPSPAAERRVVFAVREVDFGPAPSGAKAYIEPIALVSPLGRPPRGFEMGHVESADDATAAFAHQYFREGRTYRVVHGGTVRVSEPAFSSCVSLVATVSTETPLPAIATNFDVPERPVRDRDASDEEAASLLAYGKRYFRNRLQHDTQLELTGAFLIDVDPATEPLLVGEIRVAELTQPSVPCPPGALLVVARITDVSASRLTPQLTLERGCEESGDPIVFGHFDFDSDGVDEIIAITHGKEGYDYELYGRAADGWKRVLFGGGAGC